ncbi:MAG: hypothetical protein D6E12_10595 [Desulfovibrio sp.]|nr:MAG: hypothetical protein D6E12_10595 [Desulfovibrio sp.]
MRSALALFFIVVCTAMLAACVETNLVLIPEENAVFVAGLEGQWTMEHEPETVLCMRIQPDSLFYELTNPDDPGEVVIMAFLPLIEHHYLVRWEEEGEEGPEVLYTIVRQELDGLFAAMLSEKPEIVDQAAQAAGYPDTAYDVGDYSLLLTHPDREQQLMFLAALAELSHEFPGLRYTKVGELPCSP